MEIVPPLKNHHQQFEFQIRLHTERLELMEYLHRRSGKQGSHGKYELLVDADQKAETWQVGLIDVEKLRKLESEKDDQK